MHLLVDSDALLGLSDTDLASAITLLRDEEMARVFMALHSTPAQLRIWLRMTIDSRREILSWGNTELHSWRMLAWGFVVGISFCCVGIWGDGLDGKGSGGSVSLTALLRLGAVQVALLVAVVLGGLEVARAHGPDRGEREKEGEVMLPASTAKKENASPIADESPGAEVNRTKVTEVKDKGKGKGKEAEVEEELINIRIVTPQTMAAYDGIGYFPQDAKRPHPGLPEYYSLKRSSTISTVIDILARKHNTDANDYRIYLMVRRSPIGTSPVQLGLSKSYIHPRKGLAELQQKNLDGSGNDLWLFAWNKEKAAQRDDGFDNETKKAFLLTLKGFHRQRNEFKYVNTYHFNKSLTGRLLEQRVLPADKIYMPKGFGIILHKETPQKLVRLKPDSTLEEQGLQNGDIICFECVSKENDDAWSTVATDGDDVEVRAGRSGGSA